MLIDKKLLNQLIDLATVSVEYLNDRWITVHPQGHEKGQPLLVKDGESNKEAIDRKFSKSDDKKEDINPEDLLEKSFFVKSSKGSFVPVEKKDNKWYKGSIEVKRKEDIDYLEKQLEAQKEDIKKEFKTLKDDLSSDYGLWDSGNLTTSQQKMLDKLLEKKIIKREKGIAGEHDTYSGTAKYIYRMK